MWATFIFVAVPTMVSAVGVQTQRHMGSSPGCPKCGIVKKTKQPSCCAPGGAWFKNCGDPGDSKFDHTWLEGMGACKKTATSITPSCLKCGVTKKSGKRSCCASGGSWFNNCGDPGDSKFDHTWLEGMEACKKTATPTTTTVIATPSCSKCVTFKKSGKKSGKLSCCAPGGAWSKNCGNPGDSEFDHTWLEGIQACKSKFIFHHVNCKSNVGLKDCNKKTTAAPSCSKCGANKKKAGQLSCCVKGGAWFKNCGDPGDSKFDHTWDEGIEACEATCPECGINELLHGRKQLSCCVQGGTWFKNCGDPGDSSEFDHTWDEGVEACRSKTFITPPAPCPKCGVTKKSGKRSCCARGGAWFENCGDPGDSKFDHTWDEGVGACKTTITVPTTPSIATKAPILSSSTCPKCAKKAGAMFSNCCFPGGAWFNNCGSADDPKFDHTWTEGLAACAPATATTAPDTSVTLPTAPPITCPKCGVNNAGKRSCCFRGGAWVDNCGDTGDPNFDHTWAWGLKTCNNNNKPIESATTTPTTVTSVTLPTAPPITCPKCGVNTAGKRSCCFRGGAWVDNCGDTGDPNFDHTWAWGLKTCNNKPLTVAPTMAPITTAATPGATGPSTSKCARCGIGNAGKLSCCFRGGAWFDNCAIEVSPDFEHTWFEGIDACKDALKKNPATSRANLRTVATRARTTRPRITRPPTRPPTKCPKCGSNAGIRFTSCCFPGGAWFNNCGDKGDHTWAEGSKACQGVTRKAKNQIMSSSQQLDAPSHNSSQQQSLDSMTVGVDSKNMCNISSFTLLISILLMFMQMYYEPCH